MDLIGLEAMVLYHYTMPYTMPLYHALEIPVGLLNYLNLLVLAKQNPQDLAIFSDCFALVGYEMIKANLARHASLAIYHVTSMCAHGIFKYMYLRI